MKKYGLVVFILIFICSYTLADTPGGPGNISVRDAIKAQPAVVSLTDNKSPEKPAPFENPQDVIQSRDLPPTAGSSDFKNQNELLLDPLELLCPDGSIYDQHPINSLYSYTSDIGYGWKAFEKFEVDGEICDIHFWGGKLSNAGGWHACSETPQTFQICFYADDGTGYPDTTNPQYCSVQTLTGFDTGEIDALGTPIYRWDAPIDPCISFPNAWVSIQAGYGAGDDTSCVFLWLETDGDDYYHKQLKNGVWYDNGVDLAYCLTGVPYDCRDQSTWDNGDADEVNGWQPSGGWIGNGIFEDLQFIDYAEFSCMRFEFIDFTTPLGQPSNVDSIRVRFYSYTDSIQELDWSVDGGHPVYDYTYTKPSTLMKEYDSGIDLYGGDIIYWDLCGPWVTLYPGNYVIYVTFPSEETSIYWASATNAHANNGFAVWGPDYTTPSSNGSGYELAFHLGFGDCVPVGACCNDQTGTCIDNVRYYDCPAENRFVLFTYCSDLYPPCGESLGACCVEGECYGPMLSWECDAITGTWYIGETCNTMYCSGLECEDNIHDNGLPDDRNGVVCDNRPYDGMEAWIVDDVLFGSNVEITDFHWWAITDELYSFIDMGELLILEDDGGTPGDTVFTYAGTCSRRPYLINGSQAERWSRPVYIYSLILPGPLPLDAGTYWFGMRPINTASNTTQNYILSSPGPFADYSAHFLSDYFGYPDWTPLEDIFGMAHNFAFCITGAISGFEYLPGDCNMAAGQWQPSVIGADVTYLVNYFRSSADPCLLDGFYVAADVNGDCNVYGSDVTYLVNYFRGLNGLLFCPAYEPVWPPFPPSAPAGWPNCEIPIMGGKSIQNESPGE